MQERQKLLLLSLVVGICSALAAQLLLLAIESLKNLVQLAVHKESMNFLYFVLPGIGMALSLFFVKRVIKDNIGHGVTKVLYAISRNESKIKSHNIWSSLLSSSVTIGLGGSVGAEAPIVYTGAAIGSNLGRISGLSYKNITILLGCGAAGAIAGIFKAPMAGLLFTMEILLFNVSLSTLTPMLLSTLSAAVVAYIFSGTHPVFECNLVAFSMANIPFYVVLGIVCALGSLYFMRTTLWLEDKIGKMKNSVLRCILCALGLGLLISLFPMLYGEGYDSLGALLTGRSISVFSESPFSILTKSHWSLPLFFLLVFLLKVFAMTFTNAGGGVGGTFGPTLFAGAILGFVFARYANLLGFSVPEQNFALVGMAGLMAGVMQAPLTAIFLIAEVSGGYQLMLPLIITSTISFGFFRIFERYSIYSKRIASKGELLTHDNDQAVLTLLKVGDLVKDKYPRVGLDDSLGKIAKVVSGSSAAVLAVVDENNIFQGLVSVEKIRNKLFNREKYNTVHVYNLLEPEVPCIFIDEKMESVMKKFESCGAWRLPVLDRENHYLGCLSNARILMAYREELKAITTED